MQHLRGAEFPDKDLYRMYFVCYNGISSSFAIRGNYSGVTIFWVMTPCSFLVGIFWMKTLHPCSGYSVCMYVCMYVCSKLSVSRMVYLS
jgi:hypothetical protein